MNELFYDKENKKFYVKELDSVNNVVTDEQYVDVTDEIVTLIQEHVTKDGKKVICLDTTFTVEQEQPFKSLCPQLKQERQIKEGDKVSIHCRKDREKDIIAIYDGKVGKVTDIWDKRYPWGHIAVKLDDGCNNSFHEDELEVLDESHWKPNEEQMEALNKAIPVCMGVVGRDAVVPLESLCEELEKLM